MSEIQFIFEKPQQHSDSQSSKLRKRSRLITSCDTCRSRKIKCRTTGRSSGRCEACVSSGNSCVFGERDRVRTKRGIASFTVSPAISPTYFSAKSAANRAIPPTLSYTGLASSGVCSIGTSLYAPIVERPVPSDSTLDENTPLFDTYRPNYPHPRLLPHLIYVFLDHAGSIFPFFEPDKIIAAAHEGSLSPLLANSLAAYAARFSERIIHIPGSRHLSGEGYSSVAKDLLTLPSPGKLERLHAIILIAWVENGSGRSESFYTYSRLAASLAMELDLGSEEHICRESSEMSRDQLRMTFWSVVWLEIAACTANGKRCLLRVNECSTSMPLPEVGSCGSLSRSAMYQALKGIFALMICLIEISNVERPDIPSTFRDTGLRQLQQTILALRCGLPPSLKFDKNNFAFAAYLREEFMFYLLHALIDSMVVALHCPSLFWKTQSPKSLAEVPRLDIAWTSALAVVDVYSFLQEQRLGLAVGLSSSFIPISIARGALLLAGSSRHSAFNGLSMSMDQIEETNRRYLRKSMELLMSLSTFWASISNLEIAAERVALCGLQIKARGDLTIPRTADVIPNTWLHSDEDVLGKLTLANDYLGGLRVPRPIKLPLNEDGNRLYHRFNADVVYESWSEIHGRRSGLRISSSENAINMEQSRASTNGDAGGSSH
ncbi:hypothetical protein M0805_005962 [Coniferiporia weirii]|nr:hypothetical protein M0805_005962 [Coniferiporia weirii]